MKNELKTLIPGLRRFAYSLTGSIADADDLLQDTLAKLLANPPAPDIPLQRWAFTLCRNLWIDQYRANRTRQRYTEAMAHEVELSSDGEGRMLAQRQLEEVSAAMDQLPSEQREVLALVAVGGLSYKEAAATLAVPTGTVMSRLARARSALCERFRPTAAAIGDQPA